MDLKHLARQIFIGSTCAQVGAAFTETSLGSIVRASEGMGVSGFLPAIPYGISFAAGVFLIHALKNNQRNAIAFAIVALCAAIVGYFVFETPEIKSTGVIAPILITTSAITTFLLSLAYFTGRYPLANAEAP